MKESKRAQNINEKVWESVHNNTRRISNSDMFEHKLKQRKKWDKEG